MSLAASGEEAAGRPTSGRLRSLVEGAVHTGLLLCAGVSVFTTVGIVALLLVESLQFFQVVSLGEFLSDTRWTPLLKPFHYGILPLLCGTVLVATGAAIVAIPLGLGTAVFLSEYAPRWAREIIKPALEILAGVPSVVYGFLGLYIVSPFIQHLFDDAGTFNAASACIVVGIMILPMVVSLSEDVLRAVPQGLREAAFALGATKFDVIVRVVLPAAMSGIVASFLLAISRAVGETMAVTMCAGAQPNLTLNPLEGVQTMTAFIVQISQGDAEVGSPAYRAIFAVGLSLFCTTMLLNLISQLILSRMREQYE